MELKKLRSVILTGLALIGVVASIFLAKKLIDNKAAAVAPARKIIKEVESMRKVRLCRPFWRD